MNEKNDKLINIFQEISSHKEINLETNIEDLNLDSLDILDALMKIRKDLDIEVDINDFILCKNIESLAKLINRI
jgi:acyl carrier protein